MICGALEGTLERQKGRELFEKFTPLTLYSNFLLNENRHDVLRIGQTHQLKPTVIGIAVNSIKWIYGFFPSDCVTGGN